MSHATANNAPMSLLCVSGPDHGRRCPIGPAPTTLGRATSCNVLSVDPNMANTVLAVVLHEGDIWFHATGGAASLDGRMTNEDILRPGQSLRLGASVWQLAADTPRGPETLGAQLVDSLNAGVASAIGVQPISGFNAREMFSDVLKRRTPEEVEAYFISGTPATTPTLAQIDTSWPRPWAFVRLAILAVAVYLGFDYAFRQFHNIYFLPAIMLMGSFAIPCSLLVFYYEVNAPRNVSLYQMLRLFMTGSVLSLLFASLIYSEVHPVLGTWLGAIGIGLVEESAKAACLFLVIDLLKYRWTLNGLLFGATIGTGFAVFESAGYAFNNMFVVAPNHHGLLLNPPTMLTTIDIRGALALCGSHAVWTGLVGAALWRIRGARPFEWKMLLDVRFLRVFALAVALHAAWDSPFPSFYYLKYVALGVVGWMATFGFIQDGLNQIREAQSAAGVRTVAAA